MRPTIATLAAICALVLGACADTVQQKPIPHNILEGLIVAPHAVYWLGARFHGLPLTEAVRDPSGAYSVEYGNCVEGGQGTCVPPLRVVSSPDNSFVPGAGASTRAATVRSLAASVAQGGRTIVLATGAVVVGIYADKPALAAAAAQTMVPIDEPGTPESPLPAALPDTGFDRLPLPSQVPSPLRPVS